MSISIFAGAGLAKACGLPTTSELPKGFLTLGPTDATPHSEVQFAISHQLKRFWRSIFRWSDDDRWPSLEDHFTLVDLSANAGHHLGKYSPSQLRAIRRISIHRAFDILDQNFEENNELKQLLKEVHQKQAAAVITTNWDTVLERHLVEQGIPYHYGVPTWELDGRPAADEGVRILKLHGSSNWLYCDRCRRIYQGPPGGGKTALRYWNLLLPSDFRSFPDGVDVASTVAAERQPKECPYCEMELSARVATFSFRKGMDFFQFHGVWESTLRALCDAPRWLFVGYSLPDADYEIRHLLKTAEKANHTTGGASITAVVNDDGGARARYLRFFGEDGASVELKDFSKWYVEENGLF